MHILLNALKTAIWCFLLSSFLHIKLSIAHRNETKQYLRRSFSTKETKHVKRNIEEIKSFPTSPHCNAANMLYEELPSYENLSFTSSRGEEFTLPHSSEYIKEWNAIRSFVRSPHKVRYLRDHTQLTERAALGDCTSTLRVLSHLVNRVNEKHVNEKEYGNLMVAYDELRHLHRDGDYIDANNHYIGNDIDMLASLETAVFIANLESELFENFGWSMRAFVNSDGYTVFIQLMAVCDHVPREAVSPISDTFRPIEIYPLALYSDDGTIIAKDLWQGTKYARGMMYPTQCIDFKSAAIDEILHLQLPHKPDKILECLYGDWNASGGTITDFYSDCTHYVEEEDTVLVESSSATTSDISSEEGNPTIPSQEQVDEEQNAVQCHADPDSYDNTIKYKDGEDLSFTIRESPYEEGEQFSLATDNTYLQQWNGLRSFAQTPGSHVRYLRNTTELSIRGNQGGCANALDVLSYIMNKINKHGKVLMMGYGELIHMHRENDFVNKTTLHYLDDDFDMWGTLDTIAFVAEMEEKLFTHFGWSMRAFINGHGYIFFMQVMATCGHIPIPTPSKVHSQYPAIELYALPIITNPLGRRIAKDLWQGTVFDATLMYPPKCIDFYVSGRDEPIPLQIPQKSVKILNCLYGTWTVYSSKHADVASLCADD